MTLYGATFQDVGSGATPSLSQVQNAYGKIVNGKYVAGSLPLVQVYYGDPQSVGTGSQLPTAFSTGKAGANRSSVICCFKGPPATIIAAAAGTVSNYKNFFTDMYNFVTTTAPHATVYWVYEQEVDAAVRGNSFKTSDFRAALAQLQSWASAAVVAAGGTWPHAQMPCSLKFTSFGALQTGADNTLTAAMQYFLTPTGVDFIGWDTYGAGATPAGCQPGAGYATPPWPTLSHALTSMNGTITSPPSYYNTAWFTGYPGGLDWGITEFGSVGLPNACGSTVPPSDSTTGWDVSGLAAWYATMNTYFTGITAPSAPILICLYDSLTTGAGANTGGIICGSPGVRFSPSWGYEVIIAPVTAGTTSPAKGWQTIVQGSTSTGGTSNISAVGALANVRGTALKTLSVNPTAVGDLLVLGITMSGGSTVSAVSGGGVTTWAKAAQGNPGSVAGDAEIWWGMVTTTGAATITITTVAAGSICLAAQQFTAGGANWTQDGAGASAGSTSNTASGTYPAQTPTGTGELYISFGIFDGSSPTGSTAGYAYNNGFQSLRGAVWNLNASSPNTYAPAWAQATTGAWSAASALFIATPVAQSFVGACELGAYRVA